MTTTDQLRGDNGHWALTAPRSFEWRPRPSRPLSPGSVRIRFAYCGVCGSDTSMYEGRRELSVPLSLGHEFVATVVGINCENGLLRVGDVVTSDLNYRCGQCTHCVSGRSHLCEHGQVRCDFSNRAFAYEAEIHESYLTRLEPSDLHAAFALCEPLSCVLHALEHVAPSSTDLVLVLGCGGLGLCMALAICEDSSLPRVHMWDVEANRRSAIQLASNGHIQIVEPALDYDITIDLTGAVSGLRRVLQCVRSGGRVVSMSHLDGYGDTAFLLPMLTRRDVVFTESYLNGDQQNVTRAASIIRSQWNEQWDDTLGMHSLADVPHVFEQRRHSVYCKDVIRI